MQALREYCTQHGCEIDAGECADDEGGTTNVVQSRRRVKAPKPKLPCQSKLQLSVGRSAMEDVKEAVRKIGVTTRSACVVQLTAKASEAGRT